MAFGFVTRNLPYKVLAVFIAVLLWGVAHGTRDEELGFDFPIVLENLPENVVVVDQNSDVVNVRLQGSRAGLRRVAGESVEYRVDVAGSRPGRSEFEVDTARLDLPRGVRPVSRSPSELELTFERRSSRVVRLKPDLEGEPAEGFVLAGVDLEPTEVRIEGARSEVRRLGELVTEAIDLRGLDESEEREVKVSLTRSHVWLAEAEPIRARIRIKPVDPENER